MGALITYNKKKGFLILKVESQEQLSNVTI